MRFKNTQALHKVITMYTCIATMNITIVTSYRGYVQGVACCKRLKFLEHSPYIIVTSAGR